MELFLVTNNKGIGNNLWKYFPNLWDHVKIVEETCSLKTRQDSDRVKIDNVLVAYQKFYEFTIHHLVEFALVIAENSKAEDWFSKKYVDDYNKKRNQGQILMKGKLLEYCKNKKFLKQGHCSIFNNAWIRNSIAHANYRYDDGSHKLIFGKKEMTSPELEKSLRNLYAFNIFLLSQYLERSNVLKNLVKIIEQTPIPKS